MKIQNALKIATLAALLSIGSANAQTADSTWLPWTSAPVATFRPTATINTYVAQGWASGRPNAVAYAHCGGNKMISGGGYCTDGYGMTSLAMSQPNGNGWNAGCSSLNGFTATAGAFAVCSY
jgi:hypothetical protein